KTWFVKEYYHPIKVAHYTALHQIPSTVPIANYLQSTWANVMQPCGGYMGEELNTSDVDLYLSSQMLCCNDRCSIPPLDLVNICKAENDADPMDDIQGGNAEQFVRPRAIANWVKCVEKYRAAHLAGNKSDTDMA
ncbi:unnamed protein product, partial [Amoebophrya sp. A25]